MLPPFYYKDVGEEGLYRYFSEVVQRVGDARLRIYLYHIPPVAIVGITPGLVERLLKAYPNAIAGMKDSSSDWNNTKTFLTRLQSARTGGLVHGLSAANRFFSQTCAMAVRAHFATANVNPAAIYERHCSVRCLSGCRSRIPTGAADRRAQRFQQQEFRR
jgi:4-hydroxy-tetrahydrodipicolinate synthase